MTFSMDVMTRMRSTQRPEPRERFQIDIEISFSKLIKTLTELNSNSLDTTERTINEIWNKYLSLHQMD